VVGIFPSHGVIIRLVGVVPAEQNDEWTESRRYMGLEILAACRKTTKPDMGQNIISETGLTIEAIPRLSRKWIVRWPFHRPCRRTRPIAGDEETMVTVNLTMDEAQAVAGAMRELIERTELNELILGPIDWDDLRTARNKLTAAIDEDEA